MHVTTLSEGEFEANTARAMKMAEKEPVFIADGDKPSHVLLCIDAYRRLVGGARSLPDALSMSGLAAAEIDVRRPSALPRIPRF